MLNSLTIAQLLRFSPLERLETRLLLQYVLQVDHAWLITHLEQQLNAQQANRFLDLVSKRIAGQPIAYLIEEREFYGLRLRITPQVLIPRPETELLVERAIELISNAPPTTPMQVLDLGTGSGAIAIAIAKAQPKTIIYATDQSSAALAVARQNAQTHQAAIRFFEGSWFLAVPDCYFDLIVSNPPYIRQHDPHLGQGDLRFEPIDALTDHSIDGLKHIRHIIMHAPAFLKPGGTLWIEHGYNQAKLCRQLLTESGFTQVQSIFDLNQIERVSGGQWEGSSLLKG